MMRALVFLGVVVIATLLAEPMAATAQQSGDFTYLTNASGITITKYTGSANEVIIPDTIDGLPVTIVETNAVVQS